MQITDTIADLLTRIRNANSAKHATVDVPASNMKKSIAQILVDEDISRASRSLMTANRVSSESHLSTVKINHRLSQDSAEFQSPVFVSIPAARICQRL